MIAANKSLFGLSYHNVWLVAAEYALYFFFALVVVRTQTVFRRFGGKHVNMLSNVAGAFIVGSTLMYTAYIICYLFALIFSQGLSPYRHNIIIVLTIAALISIALMLCMLVRSLWLSRLAIKYSR